jgi:hypothetical protein
LYLLSPLVKKNAYSNRCPQINSRSAFVGGLNLSADIGITNSLCILIGRGYNDDDRERILYE